MFVPLADKQRCKIYISGIHSMSLPTSRPAGEKNRQLQAASIAGQGLQSHTEVLGTLLLRATWTVPKFQCPILP